MNNVTLGYAVIWEPRINKGEAVATFTKHSDAVLFSQHCVKDEKNVRIVAWANIDQSLLDWLRSQQ